VWPSLRSRTGCGSVTPPRRSTWSSRPQRSKRSCSGTASDGGAASGPPVPTRSAGAGRCGPCEATVVAVVRAYGVVALVVGVGLAAVFTAADAPVRLVAGAAGAPLLALVVVIVHEAAHWSVLRLLRGGHAGAVVVGWRTCMIVHAVLPARQDRLVAAAGPGAGLLVSLCSLPITLGDFAGAYTSVVLVIVNLLGFTPLTSDGRRVLGVQEACG
jgi:hypothetical protein